MNPDDEKCRAEQSDWKISGTGSLTVLKDVDTGGAAFGSRPTLVA